MHRRVRHGDSKPFLSEMSAILNSFIVGLENKLGYSNLASTRRHFDALLNLKLASLS